MEHKTLEQLQGVADLHPDRPREPPMSKRERVDRWIALLERNPERLLNTLPGTEYQAAACRERMHCSNSALSIAYDDPVLRAEGLSGETYGEARRFFGLSHGELHCITCYCHNGARISAGSTAWRLRAVTRDLERTGFFARAWQFLVGR